MSSKVLEALKNANLHFTPTKLPHFVQVGRKRVKNPKSFSIARVEGKGVDRVAKILGTCGPSYTPVSNFKAFEFLDVILNNQTITSKVEYLRSLRNDQAVAFCISTSSDVIGKYRVHKRITIVNSHDGRGSIEGLMTPRIENLDGRVHDLFFTQESYRFRHTPGVELRLKSATRLLDLTQEFYTQLQSDFVAMMITPTTSTSDESFQQMLYVVVPGTSKQAISERVKLTTVLNHRLYQSDSTNLLELFLEMSTCLTEKRRVRDKSNIEYGNLTGACVDSLVDLRSTALMHTL